MVYKVEICYFFLMDDKKTTFDLDEYKKVQELILAGMKVGVRGPDLDNGKHLSDGPIADLTKKSFVCRGDTYKYYSAF